MKYKVVKEFACAKKGDIIEYNEEHDLYEFNIKEEGTTRFMCMDEETAEAFVEEGNLIKIDENTTIDRVLKLIEEMLEQYEEDRKDVIEKYNNQEIPTCVKVEADTVYYNLTKVLNRIKEEIEA